MQVFATAYHIVFHTGLFNDNCKAWKRKADAYKTWANFKVDFATLHQKWQESQATSAVGASFQSANIYHQQKTLDTFATLANSTARNRSAVEAFTVKKITLAAE